MPRPQGHTKWNPSSANEWIPCPFSKSIEVPDRPTAASIAGDEAHEYGADLLANPGKAITIPSEFRTGVEMYTEHVLANNAVVMVERNFQSFEVPDHGGTIDAFMLEDRVAVLYDYKNGRFPVDIRDNPQLLCYDGLVSEHFEIDTFHNIIVQPNAFKGPKIKKVTFTKQEVAGHRLKVIDAVEHPERKQTGDHCRWCALHKTNQCEEGVRYCRAKGWN